MITMSKPLDRFMSNDAASRLAKALYAAKAQSVHKDSIDCGLILRRVMEEEGFGIVDLRGSTVLFYEGEELELRPPLA